MKNKTKRTICQCIIVFNVFLIMGIIGTCELNLLPIKECIENIGIIAVCTIIPAIKTR